MCMRGEYVRGKSATNHAMAKSPQQHSAYKTLRRVMMDMERDDVYDYEPDYVDGLDQQCDDATEL